MHPLVILSIADNAVKGKGTKGAFAHLTDLGVFGAVYFVVSCNSSVASVVIPSSYTWLPVMSVKYRAFQSRTSLVSVTIPYSVVSVGAHGFKDSSKLSIAF